VKKFIVKFVLNVFQKKQKQQCYDDEGTCLGEKYDSSYGFGFNISKSWWVELFGVAFIFTISNSACSYEIMRFNKTILSDAFFEEK
jgi:hypothetical protein